MLSPQYLAHAIELQSSRSMSSRTPSPSYTLARKHSLGPLICLLILVNLSSVLYTIPLNRVIEFRLCEEHYRKHGHGVFPADGSIPEKQCKIDQVQEQLAWIQGVMETTLVVCDFLVTIPFSFIAEKWGVRVVLWCNLAPRVFLSAWAIVVGHYRDLLPTKTILAGPFLNVLGGECVFQSTVFTLTSALTSGYVQRASYFSYISSTSYVVSFMGPSLAAYTMSKNLWLPFWLSIALLTAAIPTIRMLPRSQVLSLLSTPSAQNGDDDDAPEEVGPLLGETNSSSHRYSNAFEASPSISQSINLAIRKTMNLATGRRNFQILLCSFFLTALASSDTKLLVQYISKRYQWTFAEAGYLLSAKALVNFTLLTMLIPRIIRRSIDSKIVHGSEVRLNVLGAEASILISVIGVFCVALAFKFWILLAALVIYALGSALPVFTMSLVKSPLVALAHSDIQDFSLVMLTKTLGSLVGAPLMTLLWVQAIRLGGGGLGLPYLVSGCVYLMAAYVITRLNA